jgi:protein fantom
MRGTKIEMLEREMTAMAITPRTLESKSNGKMLRINLRPGQNMISVHLKAAIFSQDGCEYLEKKKKINYKQTEFTTCATIDFADFETEVSSLGFGIKPCYDYTSNYILTIDDYFLNYLETTSIPITIYHTNGMEFIPIGYTFANFVEIVTKNIQSFTYISDIFSSEKTVIGQIEYELNIEISIPLAIRAYHERTTALNLMQKSNLDLNHIPFDQKPDGLLNNLQILIDNGEFTKTNNEFSPMIYGTIHFDPLWRSIIIPPKPSNQPEFKFAVTIPLKMTADLDRQLRSGKILVVFADDKFDWNYGYAKIPLMDLALGLAIADKINIQNAQGITCGFINVDISWQSKYSNSELKVLKILKLGCIDIGPSWPA